MIADSSYPAYMFPRPDPNQFTASPTNNRQSRCRHTRYGAERSLKIVCDMKTFGQVITEAREMHRRSSGLPRLLWEGRASCR